MVRRFLHGGKNGRNLTANLITKLRPNEATPDGAVLGNFCNGMQQTGLPWHYGTAIAVASAVCLSALHEQLTAQLTQMLC